MILGGLSIIAVISIGVGVALGGAVGLLGLLGAVAFGAGVGFLGGATASIISQGISSGWNSLDPMMAIEDGAIGALIGAIGGATSYGLGAVGNMAGEIIGQSLSDMLIGGVRVAKAFEYLGGAKMITTL